MSHFVHLKTIKARKNYACAACGIVIPRRCHYVRSFDAYDGSGSTTKWHVECREAFDKMLTDQHETEAPPDWTWDDEGVPRWLVDKYTGIAFENEVLDDSK